MTGGAHYTDYELLELYKSTKQNYWLGILFKRYNLLVFGVGMKYLKDETQAKDLMQQVFEKVLSEIDKYEITHFKSWLYIVCKNQCLYNLRKKGQIVEIGKVNFDIENENDIEEKINLEENIKFLYLAIENLNKEQAECIKLFYLQKMSYQQIANTTQYSLMQVKSHIQNGKRNLKILINGFKKSSVKNNDR